MGYPPQVIAPHALVYTSQAIVVAIGSFSVQQWRGPAWNSPIWPLLPLLLNRLVELIALCLGNIFTSITARLKRLRLRACTCPHSATLRGCKRGFGADCHHSHLLLCSRVAVRCGSLSGSCCTGVAQTSAVQVFLAVINLILCTQRTPCTSRLAACIGVTLAIAILILEVRNCKIPGTSLGWCQETPEWVPVKCQR